MTTARATGLNHCSRRVFQLRSLRTRGQRQNHVGLRKLPVLPHLEGERRPNRVQGSPVGVLTDREGHQGTEVVQTDLRVPSRDDHGLVRRRRVDQRAVGEELGVQDDHPLGLLNAGDARDGDIEGHSGIPPSTHHSICGMQSPFKRCVGKQTSS